MGFAAPFIGATEGGGGKCAQGGCPTGGYGAYRYQANRTVQNEMRMKGSLNGGGERPVVSLFPF